MSKLSWDLSGQRKYETGVSHGVLYPQVKGKYPKGVAWNGLSSVTESPSGAEPTPVWADNMKYLNLMSVEEFAASIEAYMYPEEFEPCQGNKVLAKGIIISQQEHQPFGMTYRSIVGNDTAGNKYGYKLHLIYGAVAAPAEKNHATTSDSPEPMTLSWELSSSAVAVPGYAPTSSLTIDSTKVSKTVIQAVEDVLYGTSETEPRLPLPDELFAIMREAAANEVNIYGVTWDLSSSNKLTRTDAAATFADPVPAVNGVGGSSPFDNLMPWSGMQIVQDELAGVLVSIPKFWYRIVHDGTKMSVQIADKATDGFFVSPAHADRGDGNGERDVVYIGRYKCAGANGFSVSGSAPIANATRSAFRTTFAEKCAEAGVSGYSLQDFAMFWTTRMLMLVEYATWDMQSAIGYGCGNGESAENTGATDVMTYHTGTVQTSIDTYGVGVQYRYIEDMWGNVAEWIDGWYTVLNEETEMFDVYVNTKISEYSDTEGGVKIGSIAPGTFGLIKDWHVPTAEGYSWAMIPSAVISDEEEMAQLTFTEYVADLCGFDGPALVSGGCFGGLDPLYGPFMLLADVSSYAESVIGARLQKIP